ncbi:MAG: transposase [Acidimicrobiia bacterium]|nr:transposase [Acidimicrobiia bacterium]
MPAKNIVKKYFENQYYHVYNRGVNKDLIFRENSDKDFLLKLFNQRLSKPTNINKTRILLNPLGKSEILSFCLLDNHYHLLFWLNNDTKSITKFMHSIFTSYTMYFNLKYDRVGPLFQSRYKASIINNDPYLIHISRYIHLNPSDYENYKYSSYQSYLGENTYPWLKISKILDLFKNSDYEEFVKLGIKDQDLFKFE